MAWSMGSRWPAVLARIQPTHTTEPASARALEQSGAKLAQTPGGSRQHRLVLSSSPRSGVTSDAARGRAAVARRHHLHEMSTVSPVLPRSRGGEAEGPSVLDARFGEHTAGRKGKLVIL